MKLVIVLGSPRSGTTWIESLLAGHPEVAGCSTETHLFPRLLAPLIASWHHMRHSTAGLDKDVAPDEFDRACREFALSMLRTAAAPAPGARALVEKTPANAIVWPTIHRLFPEAYFVHAVRDPRDVVCSIRAASRSWGRGWAPSSAIGAARIWREHVDQALGISGQTDRVCLVRYESMLASGPSELERLFRFVGLESDATLRQQILRSCSFESRATSSALSTGFLRQGKAGTWRAELSGRDIRVVEYLTGDLMDTLGYERALPSPVRRPASVALFDAFEGIWAFARESGADWRRRARGIGKAPQTPP
jgi:hypothetical protein